MFKVLAASGIILALLAMAWQAAHSRAVVIDAFKAPPNLANRGIRGDVAAAGVLDALHNLQDATRSTAQRLNTTTACATDIKIALPQTGTDNLQLTVRGDDIPAKKIADGPNDPDKRTTAAAEYLPMIYLHRGLNAMNRGGFAAAAADFVAANTSAPHFAIPLKAWGDLLARQGKRQDALTKYNSALQYAPNWDALKQARDMAARNT